MGQVSAPFRFTWYVGRGSNITTSFVERHIHRIAAKHDVTAQFSIGSWTRLSGVTFDGTGTVTGAAEQARKAVFELERFFS